MITIILVVIVIVIVGAFSLQNAAPVSISFLSSHFDAGARFVRLTAVRFR